MIDIKFMEIIFSEAIVAAYLWSGAIVAIQNGRKNFAFPVDNMKLQYSLDVIDGKDSHPIIVEYSIEYPYVIVHLEMKETEEIIYGRIEIPALQLNFFNEDETISDLKIEFL